MSFDVVVNFPVGHGLRIGRGQVIAVQGAFTTGAPAMNRVTVRLGEVQARTERFNRAVDNIDLGRRATGSAGLSPFSGFYALATLAPGELEPGLHPVTIQARSHTGESFSFTAGTLEVLDEPKLPGAGSGTATVPLVAVCMAVFRPDPGLLERQVESLRRQTFEDWICVMRDDASGPEHTDVLRRLVGDDHRFRLIEGADNLGFYRNFEALLYEIPEQTRYVALCDQDDVWYPRKLERLIGEIATGACLVYSDMRIVDGAGKEISPSYWGTRRNEYRELDLLLVANTVTGAASLFDAGLLPLILPFPERVGDAFHDHWIACTALSVGDIGYVDEALYDYTQHGGSVIGHCDFGAVTTTGRLTGLGRSLKALFRPARYKPALIARRAAGLAIYKFECRRLKIICDTIRLRCPDIGRRKLRQLALFDGALAAARRLCLLHAKVVARRHTTDDAELRLGGAFVIETLDGFRNAGKLPR